MVARARMKINNFHRWHYCCLGLMPGGATMQWLCSARRYFLLSNSASIVKQCSALVFTSAHITILAEFASLLTLGPFRCREHGALNSMNTNISWEAKRKVLDDSINAFSSHFTLKSNSSSQRSLDVCFPKKEKIPHVHLLCRLFCLSPYFVDTFRPQFITVSPHVAAQTRTHKHTHT